MPKEEPLSYRRSYGSNTTFGTLSCAMERDSYTKPIPEKRLLKMYLHRALADASGRTGQCGESYYSKTKVNIRIDAIKWILHSDPLQPYSYHYTMEQLDYPDELIEAIQAEARVWWKDVTDPKVRRPSIWV